MVDAWRTAALTESQRVRPGADPHGDRAALPPLNRHPEEPLIEVRRALDVGHRQSGVIERSNPNRSAAPLTENLPRQQHAWHGTE